MELYLLGFTAVIFGASIRYWRARRKFYRRNMAGKEVFSSYQKALITCWMEKVAGLISSVLIVLGLMLLIIVFAKK